MKVVILAGGFGTRISEYTDTIPKPMIRIGDEPIIAHIMSIYSKFGFNDFIIALGYKGDLIKEYFINYKMLNSSFEINLDSGIIFSCFLSVIGAVAHDGRINPQQLQPTYDKNFLLSISK